MRPSRAVSITRVLGPWSAPCDGTFQAVGPTANHDDRRRIRVSAERGSKGPRPSTVAHARKEAANERERESHGSGAGIVGPPRASVWGSSRGDARKEAANERERESHGSGAGIVGPPRASVSGSSRGEAPRIKKRARQDSNLTQCAWGPHPPRALARRLRASLGPQALDPRRVARVAA
jgi:hypothetical protein